MAATSVVMRISEVRVRAARREPAALSPETLCRLCDERPHYADEKRREAGREQGPPTRAVKVGATTKTMGITPRASPAAQVGCGHGQLVEASDRKHRA